MKSKKKKNKRAFMAGIGYNGGEHTRITKTDNTYLIGGSKETHEFMQEKAIKFEEEVKKHDGKEMTNERLKDIVDKIIDY